MELADSEEEKLKEKEEAQQKKKAHQEEEQRKRKEAKEQERIAKEAVEAERRRVAEEAAEKLRLEKEAEREEARRRERAALVLQCAARQMAAWWHVESRREFAMEAALEAEEMREAERHTATLTIQMAWRSALARSATGTKRLQLAAASVEVCFVPVS